MTETLPGTQPRDDVDGVAKDGAVKARGIFDVSTPARLYRLVAVTEAITWGLLILGMALKYGAGLDAATMVPGMLHGIAFIAYVLVALYAARSLEWDWTVTGMALLASIPPFFSLFFEWFAKRMGYLGELSPATDDAPPESEPEDHFGWSIVAVIAFFPLGIPAILKSTSVGRRWADGDVDGAVRSAAQARNLCVLCGVIGAVVIVLAGLLLTVGSPFS